MHSTFVPLPHFVPIIAREFELGLGRRFDLRERDEIFKAGFARKSAKAPKASKPA